MMFDSVLDWLPPATQSRSVSPPATPVPRASDSRQPWVLSPSAFANPWSQDETSTPRSHVPGDPVGNYTPSMTPGSRRPLRRISGKTPASQVAATPFLCETPLMQPDDSQLFTQRGNVTPVVQDAALALVQPDIEMCASQVPVEDTGGDPDSADSIPIPLPESLDDLRKAKKNLMQVIFRWKKHELIVNKHSYSRRQLDLLHTPLNNISDKRRKDIVSIFTKQDTPLSRKYEVLATAWAQGDMLAESFQWIKKQSVLLTYQGDYGLVPKQEVLGEAWPSISDAAAILAKSERIDLLHTAMDALLADLFQKRSLKHYAYCIELCEESYSSMRETALSRSPDGDASSEELSYHWHTGKSTLHADSDSLRLHMHCFLDFGRVETFEKAEHLAVLGCHPWQNDCVVSRIGRSQRKNYMGFFYCQVRKFGSVAHKPNIYPFKQYLVDYNWALNLYSQNKISLGTARAIVIACKKNVPALLANLDRVEKELSRSSVERRVQGTLKELASQICTQVPMPEVDEWEHSFQEMQFRYKFLVLDGPSQMGKTMFCRSRSPCLSKLLELDCANAKSPNLAEYNPDEHEVILCDEGSVRMVLDNKKLFQAAAAFVTMCSSQTNMYSYKVWPHRLKFIITSNRWARELDEVDQDDADWIQVNSIYIHVTTPLWNSEDIPPGQPDVESPLATPLPSEGEESEI